MVPSSAFLGSLVSDSGARTKFAGHVSRKKWHGLAQFGSPIPRCPSNKNQHSWSVLTRCSDARSLILTMENALKGRRGKSP